MRYTESTPSAGALMPPSVLLNLRDQESDEVRLFRDTQTGGGNGGGTFAATRRGYAAVTEDEQPIGRWISGLAGRYDGSACRIVGVVARQDGRPQQQLVVGGEITIVVLPTGLRCSVGPVRGMMNLDGGKRMTPVPPATAFVAWMPFELLHGANANKRSVELDFDLSKLLVPDIKHTDADFVFDSGSWSSQSTAFAVEVVTAAAKYWEREGTEVQRVAASRIRETDLTSTFGGRKPIELRFDR